MCVKEYPLSTMIQHSSDGLSRKYLCALRAPAEIQKISLNFYMNIHFRTYIDMKMYLLLILNAFDRLQRFQLIILQPTHELILTIDKTEYHICPHLFYFKMPAHVQFPEVQAD